MYNEYTAENVENTVAFWPSNKLANVTIFWKVFIIKIVINGC